jgi:hypothetical protein
MIKFDAKLRYLFENSKYQENLSRMTIFPYFLLIMNLLFKNLET